MTTIPNPFPASKKNPDIRFGTYNIQSGRNGRLETCLRAMGQMGLDWGILTETKLTGGIHTRFSSDYHVFATDATSASQGGVALFYRESSLFSIESVWRHGPNCLSFQLVTGEKRHHVAGILSDTRPSCDGGLPVVKQGFTPSSITSQSDRAISSTKWQSAQSNSYVTMQLAGVETLVDSTGGPNKPWS